MFALYLVLLLIFCGEFRQIFTNEADSDEFGNDLVAALRNDANLDLSVDEEYEDLRAELLAYHTAFASLTSVNKRRSMLQTPCWTLGGICVNYRLCTGFRSLTEVPGCKGRLMVCCFAWNEYKVKDWRDKGIGLASYPWSAKQEFGGLGVIDTSKLKHIKKGKNKQTLSMAHGESSKEKSGKELIEGNMSGEKKSGEENSGEKKSMEIVELGGDEMDSNSIEVDTETKAIALLLRSNKK